MIPASLTNAAIERIGNDPSAVTAVPIEDCGELLVEVPLEPGLAPAPAYFARGITAAPERVLVRSGVLDALRRAAALLPDGVGLLVWDGLRSLQTQAAIVADFRNSLPPEGRDELVARYLSSPPASQSAYLADPPPHTTGGAVDLSLCDEENQPLDMGAEFDEFREVAWLAHFETPGRGGSHDELYRDRRRTLYWAMMTAGFAPYPWEYWHYELGTPVAAVFHHLPVAEYGAATPWI